MTKQIFMTSDLHMGHDKIRGYCNRPFKTVEEMDETIINNFNAKVKQDDTVYLLGDVSFQPDRYIDKLNGYKILVMGNHDHKKYNELYDEVYEACYFMKIGKYMCELNHYPYYYNNNVDFVIHGHIHELFKVKGNNVNIGVDQWDFEPVSINELEKFLDSLKGECVE